MRTLTWALMALFVTITASPVLAQLPKYLGNEESLAYLESHGVKMTGPYSAQVDCGLSKPVPVKGMAPSIVCGTGAVVNGPSITFTWRGENAPINEWLKWIIVERIRRGGPHYTHSKPRSVNKNGVTCSAPFSMPITAHGLVATRVDCEYRDSDTWLTSKDDFIMATFPVRDGYYATVVARPVGLFTVKWQLENALRAFLAEIIIVQQKQMSMR